MAEIVAARRGPRRPVAEPTRIVLRPPAVDDGSDFTVDRDRRAAGGCAATSPSAGCGRPTSATTRPSASSPTGSTGSASRTGCSQLGRATAVGDRQRVRRSAATGRRSACFDSREPDRSRRRRRRDAVPRAPATARDLVGSDGRRVSRRPDDGRGPSAGVAARRRQGRLVVADHRRGRHRPRPRSTALVDALAAPRAPRRRGRAGLLRRDRRRPCAARAGAPARATSPPSRPPPSVGQGLLVHRYTEAFARHGIVVGQVLLPSTT